MSASVTVESDVQRFRMFETRAALAAALAEETARALARRIASEGRAAIALSGGATPKLFLEQLSQAPLDWAHVQVTLVDERWVDPSSERSNANLIRSNLLRNKAEAATFVPLKTTALAPEACLDEVEARVLKMPLPFAAVILGMGDDGHTASFFPEGDCLDRALDPTGERTVESIRAPQIPEARMTLTFPVLNSADFLALHIEGDGKRRVLEEARLNGPIEKMPIRAFLRAQRPLEIYWSA